MNFGHETDVNAVELLDFITQSKKKSFAGTDQKNSLSDGSSVFSNRKLPWLYTDTYCGNTVERGFEDVYYDMILVWSMQYRGGTLENYYDYAEVITCFLRQALMNSPQDFPFRGPHTFEMSEVNFDGKLHKDAFIYTNKWQGDYSRFTGREEIFLANDLVFYHDYMGGLVRNKYFVTEIRDK